MRGAAQTAATARKLEHHGSSPAHGSWRKPRPSSEDPAQPINKFQKRFIEKKKQSQVWSPNPECRCKSFPGRGDVLFLFDGSYRRSSGRSNLTIFGKWVGEHGVHRDVCDVSAARDEETVLACVFSCSWGRAAFASPPSLFCLQTELSFCSRDRVEDNYLGMFQKFPNTEINYSHFQIS